MSSHSDDLSQRGVALQEIGKRRLYPSHPLSTSTGNGHQRRCASELHQVANVVHKELGIHLLFTQTPTSTRMMKMLIFSISSGVSIFVFSSCRHWYAYWNSVYSSHIFSTHTFIMSVYVRSLYSGAVIVAASSIAFTAAFSVSLSSTIKHGSTLNASGLVFFRLFTAATKVLFSFSDSYTPHLHLRNCCNSTSWKIGDA